MAPKPQESEPKPKAKIKLQPTPVNAIVNLSTPLTDSNEPTDKITAMKRELQTINEILENVPVYKARQKILKKALSTLGEF